MLQEQDPRISMAQRELGQTVKAITGRWFESQLQLGGEWSEDALTSGTTNRHHMTALPLTEVAQQMEERQRYYLEGRPPPRPSAEYDGPAWLWLDHPLGLWPNIKRKGNSPVA